MQTVYVGMTLFHIMEMYVLMKVRYLSLIS